MRRKRNPVGKPHLFLSVEPSSLGGCCIRGCMGPNGADEETTYPVFFVSSKLPSTPSGRFYNSLLAGRALRAKPEGVGSGPRALPSTPRSSLLRKHVGSAHGHRHQRHAQAFSANDCRKRVGSGHRHRHIRHAQAFSAKGWRPRFPIWTGATDILSPPATPGVKNRVVSAEQLL